MKTKAASALFALAAIAGIGLLAVTPGFTPCKTEDQTTKCVYDSSKHGDGTGHSFYVDDHGDVHYISNARAQQLLGHN